MRAANAPDEFRGSHPALFRYRLDVIASNADDVVRSAGGWLFDRAMGGWDVNLLITDPSDARPLRILGIRTCSPDSVESVMKSPRTQAIAVAADVFNTDARVRETVVRAPWSAGTPKSRCGAKPGRPISTARKPCSTD